MKTRRLFACVTAALLAGGGALAQDRSASQPEPKVSEIKLGAESGPDLAKMPWLDPSMDPDKRADLVLAQLTLPEKIQLLHGAGFLEVPAASNGGAGYVPGIGRLGIPDLNMADSTVGIARGALRSRYSTLMPATIAEAATWDPKTAYDYAALVGEELRSQGYNASLAGGANLARESRNGRTFEYRGEDPLLVGKMTAQAIRGMQDQNVIGDLKHFALNDQETGRQSADVQMDYRAARESDLLAFEIAVKEGKPGMVMCAYNRVWGKPACENAELLDRTLKKEWGFEGFVVSDWGATHSTFNSITAGLDQEQPGSKYFGDALASAVDEGRVPITRVDAAARRILRTMFAIGVVDNPPKRQVVDVAAGLKLARRVEEQGAVLLKNYGGLLPISPSVRRVAIIGGHADAGVLTGGGSGQVDPPGGNAVRGEPSDTIITPERITFPKVWWPSSPLEALRAEAPNVDFVYDDGTDPRRAAAMAASADLAVYFAYSPSAENSDSSSLSLPDGQDAVIDAVANANPRTVVVLQTGGAVTMPWVGKIGAVVAAWFPGSSGGEAIADLLLGKVNFSGKLPITFPASDADLPSPRIQGDDVPFVTDPDSILPQLGLKIRAPFTIRYPEGARVGYKWYQSVGRKPLFPFGHGLSYASFRYSALSTSPNGVTFRITNTGSREGAEVAQVYLELPRRSRLAPKQLVGWSKVSLRAGESREVSVSFETLPASVYNVKRRSWERPMGSYRVFVGGSSEDLPLIGGFSLRRSVR